jgi:hypothetical protein
MRKHMVVICGTVQFSRVSSECKNKKHLITYVLAP